MEINEQHLLQGVSYRHSPHVDGRPEGEVPSLLVLHNISLPPGCFSGDDVDALFMGTLDCEKRTDYHELKGLRVSAHCLVRRDGTITQYVPFNQRAWHAGVSVFQGRKRCNDFSIGIEIEGTDDSGYTPEQYQSVTLLVHALMQYYPKITLGRIVGHQDIAPGRKTDPGFGFNWPSFRAALMDRTYP